MLGDATNVAFRLSGLAGRVGRPDVLVTDAVHRATSAAFAFTPPSAIQVKGRRQPVQVLGASRLADPRHSHPRPGPAAGRKGDPPDEL